MRAHCCCGTGTWLIANCVKGCITFATFAVDSHVTCALHCSHYVESCSVTTEMCWLHAHVLRSPGLTTCTDSLDRHGQVLTVRHRQHAWVALATAARTVAWSVACKAPCLLFVWQTAYSHREHAVQRFPFLLVRKERDDDGRVSDAGDMLQHARADFCQRLASRGCAMAHHSIVMPTKRQAVAVHIARFQVPSRSRPIIIEV